jgi:hypothetical protein
LGGDEAATAARKEPDLIAIMMPAGVHCLVIFDNRYRLSAPQHRTEDPDLP